MAYCSRRRDRRDPPVNMHFMGGGVSATTMASPLVAVILSFFIPGLGQLYTGQLMKAIVLFVLAVIFGALSSILIGIPLYLIVWIYSMYDAYVSAKGE